MISKQIAPSGKAAGAALFAGAAAAALTFAGGPPANAAPSAAIPPKCLVQHDLYQQPVAAIIAYVEAPGESCGVGPITLKVYRNDVLVASISGSQAPHFRYDCVTTAPTAWRTNWDPTEVFNCG